MPTCTESLVFMQVGLEVEQISTTHFVVEGEIVFGHKRK